MKATEIRIGNLVKYMGREQFVTSEIIRECELNNATTWGIQLTEERLLSFGFTKPLKKGSVFQLGKFNIQSFGGLGVFECRNHIEMHFVHNLQNIYHALTGEELTPQAITSSK